MYVRATGHFSCLSEKKEDKKKATLNRKLSQHNTELQLPSLLPLKYYIINLTYDRIPPKLTLFDNNAPFGS